MSRPSRPCLPFLLKTGDNDLSVGASFPDLAINGRAEIASTSFAVYHHLSVGKAPDYSGLAQADSCGRTALAESAANDIDALNRLFPGAASRQSHRATAR
jgi:hypothetical protein